jgi:ligand-binding sensor domain-containing protein/signal transduction histidine kinase
MVPYSLKAQQVRFNRVSLPEGSYFGMINGVSQDPNGYMWFATYARGLHRYDGYHVITYLNDPLDTGSLKSNNLEAVYADRNGIIWAGTQQSGLDRLDPATGIFTHFRNRKNDLTSLSDDRIKAILEDHEGTLWIGTVNGLNRLNRETGTFTRYLYDPKDSFSLSCNQVQVLYEDRNQTLWVGTASFDKSTNRSATEGGLNRFDRRSGKFTRYLHDIKELHSLADNRIGAILEDSKQNFWVLTAGDGLHTMNRGKGTFERLRFDPANPERLSGPPRKKKWGFDMDLFFIKEDSAGGVWIGASGGWITRYDLNTKKTVHYDSFNGDVQAMETVSGAFTSHEGVLWITTWLDNIFQVNPFPGFIHHFTTHSITHSIYEDASGVIWIGTFHEGLIQHDRVKRTVTRFFSRASVPFAFDDLSIDAIYETGDTALWLGSDSGLSCYNHKTKRFSRYVHHPENENSLSKGGVADILEEKTGFLWIATSNGLDLFDIKKGVCSHYRNSPGNNNSLSNNQVTALMKDHSGNLWIGTEPGVLNCLDIKTGKFKRFTLSGIISSIAEDLSHIIWVGTNRGLFKSNPGIDSFSRFTDPRIAMTPTTVVPAILEDGQKNLWIASSVGILRFSPDRNELTIYNRNQGVDPANIQFYIMRGTKGKHGEFFFSDKTGYYSFFPDQFKRNTIPPQIVLSDFRLADQPIKPGKGSVLTLPVTQTKEIALKYNQNTFSFDFAGIHYGSPQNNQHFFMLENLDNAWRKAGTVKTAYYYKVSPGHYVFRVKATNSDGVWAEKAVDVFISLPWWRTWWAYVTYASGFIIIIWMFSWYRSRQLKKENILLEEKVIQRTSELEQSLAEKYELSKKIESQQALLNERLRISRELHDDIGSTLGSISIYSEVAKKRTEKNENTNEVLSKIGLASRELIDKMSDIVWSLNPGNESFEQLQNRMLAFAAMILAPRNIQYDLIADEGLTEMHFTGEQLKNIFLIFKEALYNTVKYADCKMVNITLCVSNENFMMTVRDDGKGFDATKMTANEISKESQNLGGNGMKNMYSRARDLNAELCIQSTIKEGTTVQLTLHL